MGRISGLRKLHHQAEFHRPAGEARPELIGQEVRGSALRLLSGQIPPPGDGKELVTAGLSHAILVHEDKSVVGKVRDRPVAGRHHGGLLYELEGARMFPKKRLDRPRMRTARVRAGGGFQQGEKILPGADNEAVVRYAFYIGEPAVGQREPDPDPARAGIRRVVRDERIARPVRKAHDHANRTAPEMSGLGELRRFGPRHERPLAHDALRMSHPMPWFDGRIAHHCFEDLFCKALVRGILRAHGCGPYRARCENHGTERKLLKHWETTSHGCTASLWNGDCAGGSITRPRQRRDVVSRPTHNGSGMT